MDTEPLPPSTASRSALAKALLGSGVGYALLYVVENDVVAARRCSGYRRISQAVSELSAKGSPARPLLVATVPFTSALMVAFGIGVWRAADGERALRMTGGLLVGQGVTGVMWLPFPMTPREDIAKGPAAVNDVGHLILSAVTVALVLAQMGTGVMAFGRRFRAYTVLSAATFLGFAALTGVESQKLPRGQPTPLLGLFERIMLGAWLLWLGVLATLLLRTPSSGRRGGARSVRGGASCG